MLKMKTNKGLCGKVLRAAWHMLCEIECIQVIELARGPYCRNIGRVIFCQFMDLAV